MDNSLIKSTFVQYKFNNYDTKKQFEPIGEEVTFEIDTIYAPEQSNYEEVVIELEPTIQYLNSIEPNVNLDLSLHLTKKYGFLYFKEHVARERERWDHYNKYEAAYKYKPIRLFPETTSYGGEDVDRWPRFVEKMQSIFKMVNDSEYIKTMSQAEEFEITDFINLALSNTRLKYSFEKHAFDISINSLDAAIVLYIISRKNYLKSCEDCSSLFFAKRNSKRFCNPTCAKRNERRIK